jgi:excisionase family DNA binding protein
MMIIDGVEMIDVQEAAALTRRTPETVRRWVWSGKLESVKSGNKLFVAKASVLEEAGELATPELSLEQWAARLASDRRGRTGRSARDLVAEDRERRAGR